MSEVPLYSSSRGVWSETSQSSNSQMGAREGSGSFVPEWFYTRKNQSGKFAELSRLLGFRTEPGQCSEAGE